MRFYIVEYELVAEKKSCNGGSTTGEYFPTVAACAASCENRGSMFIYGRQEKRCHGDNYSHGPIGTCKCFCLTDTLNGECVKGQEDDGRYDLYRIRQGKLSFCSAYSFLVVIWIEII